jgi:6-phospho-beta-glucosidase
VFEDDPQKQAQHTAEAVHRVALACADTVRLAHEMCPGAKVGCMKMSSFAYAYTCAPADSLEVVKHDHDMDYMIDVQARGYYPRYYLKKLERKGVSLTITEEEAKLLRENTVDFISFSYYNTTCLSADPNVNAKKGGGNGFAGLQNPYLAETPWGWAIDPDGLRWSLNEVWDRYQIPIMVVENGFGAVDERGEDGKFHDDYRIDYFRAHIKDMDEALADGVNLIAYTTWGCIDIVSAGTGEMKKRYGYIYVDKDNDGNGDLHREPKDSYFWYQKVIASNGEDLD